MLSLSKVTTYISIRKSPVGLQVSPPYLWLLVRVGLLESPSMMTRCFLPN